MITFKIVVPIDNGREKASYVGMVFKDNNVLYVIKDVLDEIYIDDDKKLILVINAEILVKDFKTKG